MSKTETQQRDAVTMYNKEQLANATLIQLRLDTQEVLDKIEDFLSNERKVLKKDKDTGELYEDVVYQGNALANKEGINAIMNTVYMLINRHIVQGNIKSDRYLFIIERTRKEVSVDITLNCYKWGVDETNLDFIIDKIMYFVEMFLSRAIDNEERKSFTQQVQSKEVIQQDSRKGTLSNFAGGMGG